MAIEDCAIGRGIAAVQHMSGGLSYTYYTMRSFDSTFAQFEAEGTVFGAISKKDFHKLACIVPSVEIVNAFEYFIGSIDDMIELCEKQSRNLAMLRNTLLPKLISGKIHVETKCEVLNGNPPSMPEGPINIIRSRGEPSY